MFELWKSVPEFWQGVIASIVATIIISSTLYLSGIAGKAAKNLRESREKYINNMVHEVLTEQSRNNALLKHYTAIAANFANAMWQVLVAIFMQDFLGSISFLFLLSAFYYFMKASGTLGLLNTLVKRIPEQNQDSENLLAANPKHTLRKVRRDGRRKPS